MESFGLKWSINFELYNTFIFSSVAGLLLIDTYFIYNRIIKWWRCYLLNHDGFSVILFFPYFPILYSFFQLLLFCPSLATIGFDGVQPLCFGASLLPFTTIPYAIKDVPIPHIGKLLILCFEVSSLSVAASLILAVFPTFELESLVRWFHWYSVWTVQRVYRESGKKSPVVTQITIFLLQCLCHRKKIMPLKCCYFQCHYTILCLRGRDRS